MNFIITLSLEKNLKIKSLEKNLKINLYKKGCSIMKENYLIFDCLCFHLVSLN